MTGGDEASLVLLPLGEARERLGDRPLHLVIARPSYPALGVGTLRLLRVRESGESLDLVAGYERYERL